MKTALALIALLPLLGAIGSILVGRMVPRRAVEIWACSVVWASFIATLFVAGAYSKPVVVELGTWLSSFDFKAPISFYLDPLALSLCLMITFVCGLIHLYSIGYMRDDPCYLRYFALLNLFVAVMLILVLAGNLPLLYLGWEGVGFCSYALIGFWYHQEQNATAGRKAFIVTRIGDIGLGIAAVWMFALFDSLAIPEINRMGHLVPMATITSLGLLLLLAAMGKSAQAPLMVWLPDAMAGPTPVSAQIHAATMVTAGVYLLMRMFPLIGLSSTVTAAIAITGAITAFYGASCALVERDLKRILAYSTISQIGLMMLAVGGGALTAATFHLIIHAFFKALLLLAAGCIISALDHQQDIFRMGGLRRSLPAVFWPFLAGGLCLAGVPPTGGFFSRDSILTAIWAKGGLLYGGLYWVGMVTVLLTSVYTFRMMFLVCSDRATATPSLTVTRPPRLMEIILIPLALLGLAGGLLNLPGYLGRGLLQTFLGPWPDGGHLAQAPELTLQGVTAALVFAGFAVAWLCYGWGRRQARRARADRRQKGLTAFLQAGWHVNQLYDMLLVRPYRRLSAILWKDIDEGMIDDSIDGMAEGIGLIGRSLGKWGSGRISLYLLSLAGGATLLIAWFALMTL